MALVEPLVVPGAGRGRVGLCVRAGSAVACAWCIAIQLASSRCSLPSLLLNTTSLLSGKIKVKAKRLNSSVLPTRHSEAPRINLSDLNHIQAANTTLDAAAKGGELRQSAATVLVYVETGLRCFCGGAFPCAPRELERRRVTQR